MDSTTETAFLIILEDKHDVITSKGNSKECRQSRCDAWDWVSRQLLIKTGKDFTVSQLQKKWNNTQQRLKDKTKDAKKTGGGPGAVLSENDRLTWKILGDTNPKVAMVPNAMANTSGCSQAVMFQKENDEPETSTPTPKRFKRDTTHSISEGLNSLHREVLQLQKEKLILRIEALRRDRVQQEDKGTQTDHASYLNMLFSD